MSPHHHQSGFSCPCYFALQASEKMSSWELVKPRSQVGTSLPCDGVRGTQASGLLSFLLGSSLNRDPAQVLTQGILRNPFGHWDQLNCYEWKGTVFWSSHSSTLRSAVSWECWDVGSIPAPHRESGILLCHSLGLGCNCGSNLGTPYAGGVA